MSDAQVIERVWQAPIDVIWELWSTAEGLGSWWGPKGFTVEVEELDLRTGGTFRYTMRSDNGGRPPFTVAATFTVVDAPHRLAWASPMGPATLTESVVFTESAEGVKMVLTIDSTQPGMIKGASMGWRGALDCLADRLGELTADG